MPDLNESVRDYVDDLGRHVPVSQPSLDVLMTRARRRKRLRTAATGTAAVLVAGTFAGVTLTAGHRSNPADRQGEAAAHTRSDRVDAGAAQPTSAPAKPAATVRIEGARIAPFFLPSLAAFASSDAVDGVVVGTVTKVDYEVSKDGTNEVFTIYAVRTQDASGRDTSQTITVRELGGIVPLREVRSDFEAHTGPVPDSKLDELVDYTDGRTHPVVGEIDLVFLQALPEGETAEYGGLARMTLDRSTDRFTWAGERPNSRWAASLSHGEAAPDFAAKWRTE